MALIDRASEEFERAVSELSDGSWSRMTQAGLTVGEVVEHVVAGNRFTALLLSGVTREEARARVEGDQLGSDPLPAVRHSAREQAAAFAVTPSDHVVPHPHRDVTAEAFWRFRLVDLVVHAWDVRRGADLDEALADDVVTQVWEVVEPHLSDMLDFGAYGEGPSGSVRSDAAVQSRLLDAFGRREADPPPERH